jgi:hypothetical protein
MDEWPAGSAPPHGPARKQRASGLRQARKEQIVRGEDSDQAEQVSGDKRLRQVEVFALSDGALNAVTPKIQLEDLADR